METQTRSSKYDSIFDVSFFHENFQEKFSPEDFGKKGKRKVQLPKKIYKAILKEYWDIYMKELYFQEKKNYFLFGGFLSLCRTVATVRLIRKEKKLVHNKKESSLVLVWTMRPSTLFYYCVKMDKLAGSTSMMGKIEKLFRLNNDLELLPKFEQVMSQHKKTKKLFTNDFRSSLL